MSSTIILAENVEQKEGSTFELEGHTVEVIFDQKDEKIVQVFYWLEPIQAWIDATEFVLKPENRWRHDSYLLKVLNEIQEEKESKALYGDLDAAKDAADFPI